jgi:hypothetical protein
MPALKADMRDEKGASAGQLSPAQQLFFRQLHSMLMHESSNGCVKWLEDSKGFAITDKDVFSDQILRRYFGEAKYASFTRRLKRWGFRRITKGADSGAYYHDAFHRDMSFEDYEELDELSMSPSESSQSLPAKKRMPRSPIPSNTSSYTNTFDSLRNRNADINFMPEIMREINRSKRCEKNDYVEPIAKRTKLDNDFFSNNTESSMPRSYDYASYHLNRLKQQVFEENRNQGFNMSMEPAQINLRNSRQSLSNVSTEILKREIVLRRMQQRLAYHNSSNQMHHQAPFNRYNMNMMSDVSGASSFMNRQAYNLSEREHSQSEKYAALALGTLKRPTDYSGMSSMHKNSWNDTNGNGMKASHNHSLDSMDSGKVPIHQMGPMKNPFNRAA